MRIGAGTTRDKSRTRSECRLLALGWAAPMAGCRRLCRHPLRRYRSLLQRQLRALNRRVRMSVCLQYGWLLTCLSVLRRSMGVGLQPSAREPRQAPVQLDRFQRLSVCLSVVRRCLKCGCRLLQSRSEAEHSPSSAILQRTEHRQLS